jgi:enoyl-CoA hydratase/carnithine racemase
MAVLAEQSLYGANFMALGFTPGMGATAVVPEAFGPVLGRRMLFTGELISGRDIKSAACPLSHAVYPRNQVRARARWIAHDIADGSRSAIVLLRRMVAERRRVVFEQALTEERNSHASLFADGETRREIEQRYPPSGRPAGAS